MWCTLVFSLRYCYKFFAKPVTHNVIDFLLSMSFARRLSSFYCVLFITLICLMKW